MNKKSIFTMAMAILLSGFSYQQANAARVSQGVYSGQFKVEGLTPNFNDNNVQTLIGKTIDSNSELFKNLKLLNSEYDKYYWQAKSLSLKLFESAMEKDEEEYWRYEDCVNFDYDKYISADPKKPELDDLWQKVYSIENQMRELILSNFNV